LDKGRTPSRTPSRRSPARTQITYFNVKKFAALKNDMQQDNMFSGPLQKDWQQFNDEWPTRLVLNADAAFLRYYSGEGSRAEFENVRRHADYACSEGISPVRLGHIPRWFRKRLWRVLGPKYFEHLALASPWLENWGSVPARCPVILQGALGRSIVAQQHTRVLVFEPARPWVLGGKDMPLTIESYAKGRLEWHKMFDKLLAQPYAIAKATDCYLTTERAAYSGWQNIRVTFWPDHLQDEPWTIPESYELRTCKCKTCQRGKAGHKRRNEDFVPTQKR
jgi:hypothetical protein